MASSKIEIVNVALVELGRELITSFSDDSPEATRVNAVYDQYLRDVLSKHQWSTATFQQSLGVTNNTPTHTYTFEYQLPTDPEYIRMLSINSGGVSDFNWSKQGNKILTNQTAVDITYIGFPTDPNSYGAHLTQALTWRLIAGLTYSLTGSSARHTQNLQIFNQILDSMVAEDSQEGTSSPLSSNTLTRYVR